MQRPCDDSMCICCSKFILPTETACIVAVPSKRWNRLSKKTKELMKVQWDCSRPSNCFHWSCWNEAVASAERQGTRTEICAHSILRSVHESVERFDSIETVKKHAKVFAKYLAESSYTVCFTGAGVSAAAGIPTYRGAEGIDTMDHLGGANDEAAADMPSKKRKVEMQTNVDENDESSYTALRPTFTHRALARLHTMNKMHYCVTQNCDDLHAKGGFPRDAMSELHGNVFCEFCEDCGREYHRAFEVDAWSTGCINEPWYVECPMCHWGHYTSRKCTIRGCRGKLRDTIVNFKDDLHPTILGGLPLAEANCKRADLCVALGSSLTVTPANSLPAMAGRLIICNLQETECDDVATLRVWATCDMLFQSLFEELGLDIE